MSIEEIEVLVKREVARVEAVLLEALERKEQRENPLLRCLEILSKDLHTAGTRPCGTCEFISHVLNKPFGCYELQAQMAKARAAKK